MSGEDRDREAESRRILARVAREAEADGASARTAGQARHDRDAEEADKDDWAEYWGTRIGRGLGVVLLIGLLAWLILSFMRG
jgi:hypothetical protein